MIMGREDEEPVYWDSVEVAPFRGKRKGSKNLVSGSVAEELFRQLPGGKPGLTWDIYVLGSKCKDERFVQKGKLKLRQPIPVIRAKEFFKSLVQTPKTNSWVFSGVLNGWDALSLVEVLQIEQFTNSKAETSKKVELWKVASDDRATTVVWQSGDEAAPKYEGKHTDFMKVTVRAPAYTSVGYSLNNPGSVFYASSTGSSKLRVAHGARIMGAIDTQYGNQPPVAVAVHHLVHRYVRKKPETEIQKHIYHSGCFVEFDHGKFGMVFELAFKYGIGGYDGQSNWIPKSEYKKLYDAMAPQMKAPWKSELAEVRMFEVAYTTKDELLEFLRAHDENNTEDKRFIDPIVFMSADCGHQGLTLKDIAQACLNYVNADVRYNSDLAETHRSCQTFSTDFYQFLSGDKTAKAYSPFLEPYYTSTSHLFGGKAST